MKSIHQKFSFLKDCECGLECNMPDGQIGVCQADHWTCAANVEPPNCLESKQ